MNKYVIRRVTYGLANYLLKHEDNAKERGVVIAHDCRHKSDEFTLEAARTLAACGIKSYIFDSLRTTPQLSFSVRHLGCAAGIVITASHNPPKYNGYKVYGDDGAQVMPDPAAKITDEVNLITDFASIPVYDESMSDLIVMLYHEDDRAFYDAVKANVMRPEIHDKAKELKMVYSPLCGTGMVAVSTVLGEVGFENLTIVPEEKYPDPNFAGINTPNPEERVALTRGLKLAEEIEADVLVATDPDCDRVGAAVRNNDGEYVILSGNQTGGLLVNYVIQSLKEKNKLKDNALLLTTIVTAEFGADIARANGVEVEKTLTGFKYMGNKIKQYLASSEKSVIMGYEESFGYLIGTHARDKDAVVSTMMVAEMALYYKLRGMSLYEGLEELYAKYGYYKEKTVATTLEGLAGTQKIKDIMKHFRDNHVEEVNGLKVVRTEDYINGYNNIPKSNVLKYILEDNSWIALRPSGTEPKLKVYYGTKADTEDAAEAKLEAIVNSFSGRVNELL